MENTNKACVIWSSDVNIDDWRDFISKEYGEVSEDELYRLAEEMNAEYLEDERMNLDIRVSEGIVCIGDLGLWNGRRTGYKLIGDNISKCLYSDEECLEWYVDEYGDLRCTASHHDGTNYFLYRKWKKNISESRKEWLLDLIYEGKATKKDISSCTSRLGDEIADIYGFKIKGRKAA